MLILRNIQLQEAYSQYIRNILHCVVPAVNEANIVNESDETKAVFKRGDTVLYSILSGKFCRSRRCPPEEENQNSHN